MHVTLATDGRSVAKLLRHLLDGGDDVALGVGLAVGPLEFRQCEGCKDRSCPSPEILGAEILLSDLADVLVHVARVDGPGLRRRPGT